MSDLDDVRQLVNKLYAALNIGEHQLAKEREIIQEIEDIRHQLIPLEKVMLLLFFFYFHSFHFCIHYFSIYLQIDNGILILKRLLLYSEFYVFNKMLLTIIRVISFLLINPLMSELCFPLLFEI